MKNDEIEKAAEFWDKNVQIREAPPEHVIHWLNSPLVIKHCLQKLKLDDKTISAVDWLRWAKEKYVPATMDYGLSLGCGDGALERHAVSLCLCNNIDAFDVSARSIDIAVAEATRQGISDKIRYQAADLNNITLTSGKYDLVFIGSALHHFSSLEHVAAEIRNSLKPNGLLIINEFIGPSQFQWTDKQLQIMNDLLALLPPRLRHDVTTSAQKTPIGRPSIADMNAADPSEAIRSAEILPVMDLYFETIERVDFGGTLLHLLLYGIVDNFDSDRDEDIAILRLLGYIEDMMIKEELLSSDFTCMVLQPRSGFNDR